MRIESRDHVLWYSVRKDNSFFLRGSPFLIYWQRTLYFIVSIQEDHREKEKDWIENVASGMNMEPLF